MRKLYENIEDIHIKGSPAELTEIITAMDISLQKISEGTEQLTLKLIKYRNDPNHITDELSASVQTQTFRIIMICL